MPVLPSPFDLPAGRLLSLDLGQARIGVAVCDEAGVLASPLTVMRRHTTREADFEEIRTLVKRERCVGVLVGLPESGDPGVQTRWVRRYAGRLAAALPVPLAFWDETLSTADARGLLAQAGGRTLIDAAAAAVILGDFLDARRSRVEGCPVGTGSE